MIDLLWASQSKGTPFQVNQQIMAMHIKVWTTGFSLNFVYFLHQICLIFFVKFFNLSWINLSWIEDQTCQNDRIYLMCYFFLLNVFSLACGVICAVSWSACGSGGTSWKGDKVENIQTFVSKKERVDRHLCKVKFYFYLSQAFQCKKYMRQCIFDQMQLWLLSARAQQRTKPNIRQQSVP